MTIHSIRGLALALFGAGLLGAQLDAQARPAPPPSLRVFFDCDHWRCDFDFVRTELPYVDWVRDRADADVHVLITTQPTGGGGMEYTLAFIGLRGFQGIGDTVAVTLPRDATEDEHRRVVTPVMALGLGRYLARTGIAADLRVTRPAGAAARPPAEPPRRDRWNHWVFRLNGNTNFDGESDYRSRFYGGGISGNRTTAEWKTTFSLNQNQRSSAFRLSDGREVTNFRRNLNANTLLVKSLGPRWSAGGRASVFSSTFYNQDLGANLIPAVEFNIFPYSESTRRILRFQYGAGVESVRYREETIYEKMAETVPLQVASANLGLRQPWGSVFLGVDGRQLLSDLSKYQATLSGEADLRIYKGLSFSVYSSYQLLRDQLYLPRGVASDEDLLLRRRQIATGFYYFGYMSLSYSFGSPFNNVVNPRFGR